MGKQGLFILKNWKTNETEEIVLVGQFPPGEQTGNRLDLH